MIMHLAVAAAALLGTAITMLNSRSERSGRHTRKWLKVAR